MKVEDDMSHLSHYLTSIQYSVFNSLLPFLQLQVGHFLVVITDITNNITAYTRTVGYSTRKNIQNTHNNSKSNNNIAHQLKSVH